MNHRFSRLVSSPLPRLALLASGWLVAPSASGADLGFVTPRAKQPDGFARLDWEDKRRVLFGLYGPTDEERRLIDAAMPDPVSPPPENPARVLLFYRCQYPHVSIATGVYALQRLGEASGGYHATLSDDPDVFRPDRLKEYDAVLLLHTTQYHETIGPEGQAALANYVENGGGLVGVHAAADASRDWPLGAELVGGVFKCHPWRPVDEWAIRLESPEHPLNAAFGGEGFWLEEEIYVYRPNTFSRRRSRVLLSLDTSQEHNLNSERILDKLRGEVDPGRDYPIAWAHAWRDGRVFYSNLGHNPATFRSAPILRHYLDGILFAAGRLEADVTPSADATDAALAGAPDR